MQHGTQELKQIRKWVEQTKTQTKAGIAAAIIPSAPKITALEPVAITGVSGFFPGCEDVLSFWQHLDRDESLITRIPRDRFDGAVQDGWGGFIPDIASFDAGLFKILPMEAEEMDPRQRLLLMSVWRTLEDAGIDPFSLRKSNIGVFIACEGNEYSVLMNRAGFTPKMGFGQANSMVANRISYAFDFAGPSEMVDATCAGFAVALHRAVVALRSGLIDRAIVGAANLILLPDPYIFLSEAGQLSSRNTVKSFGLDGDGFIRSEGVGTILIERRKDAVSGGRSIYADIKHTAVNFNGQGGVSMASPNTEAHAELIKTCYREAGIDPRELTYVEAQGMGAPVADIAEWSAINRALKELCAEKGLKAEPGFCRVSTLKPMLGHMHSASSLGALLKVIRSFQTGRVHKVLDFTEPNEYCDMSGTPCRIAKETESWEVVGKTRLAAIHAYGSGGNNAHILLEEARENRRTVTDSSQKTLSREFKKQRYWFQTTAAVVEQPDVLQSIRKALGAEAKDFDINAPFTELGLDSLAIAPFVSRLESEFAVSLRKSDIFSHATPEQLARYIGTLTQPGKIAFPAHRLPRVKEADHDDIAIIGMSLHVAGAENVDDFWKLLREGRSAIAPISPERLNGSRSHFKTVRGGWMSEVDAFDPLFFKISPKESAGMDPRHRKLLQAAWAAIENSGHNPDEWRGANHGIFIGIEESDYPYNEQSAITAVHAGTAPARIGYFLDTRGPVLAISTACSSSLVALHYACRSILEGESDCALAGGCNIISQPARTFYALSQMGDMLSPDGTCYAFDRRANGMVLGEGVGLVVLKRLSHALRDGDPIAAVIKGSGINYDGKTNGITAPNGSRQSELFERVYRQSGIEPSRISYVVAHGTGTSLGDPVECNALIDAFGGVSSTQAPWCALTSPKTNVGHTQAASGIVNLIAAALALKNGEIPPSLNFCEANEDISFGKSPFYVNTVLKPWDAPERLAAVSSFGHTGTNAHVVLGNVFVDEPKVKTPAPEEPVMIVLSARSEEQLKRAADNLLLCSGIDLLNLAYTLQVGRAAMEERLGFVAASIAEMRGKLRGFLEGRKDAHEVYRGQARLMKGRIENGNVDGILKWWVNGGEVDWNSLSGVKKTRRIHLPTYPFEKERYWLKTERDSAGHTSTSVSNASMPVMTFREEWTAASLNTPPGNSPRTIVCIVAEPAEEQAWRDEFRRMASDSEWILISKDAGGSYEAALRGIRQTHASIDAVLYLQSFQTGESIRHPENVLPLLRGLAAAQLAPARLMLSCPFQNELERCYTDAWIACERSLMPVLPQTKVAVIGLGMEGFKVCVETLWAELHSAEGRSALYEKGQRHERRIDPTLLSSSECPLKKNGTYLITGGGGGLGFLFAEHLAKTYSARLILTGRSAWDEKIEARLAALKSLGGDAIYVQADAGDPSAMKAALAEAKKHPGSVHGVIHAAGVEGSGSVLEKADDVFRAVLHPKIDGTLVLDEVLRDEPLEFIAYFSSSAAVLGDFGTCDYAIANRFQKAYARYRNDLRERGKRTGKTVVIHWPLWKEGGMGRAADEQTQFYLNTSGQRALESQEGLALFEQLLGQKDTGHLVLAGKADRVHRFLGMESTGNVASIKPQGGRGRKPEMKGFNLDECLQWDIKEIIGALLNIERRKLRLDSNLADFGFDSISLADLAGRLSVHYDLKITPALFFGHSTIQRLTQYFLEEHRKKMEQFYAREVKPEEIDHERVTQPSSPVVTGSQITGTGLAKDEPIAIIGMSGRFPQARNIDEMWKILAGGRNAVEEIPLERFDWRDFYGDPALEKDKSNGKWMGCLPGVAEFDPLFFEISPREAETMDPRQRHLLQESWKALEDAGYGPRQIANHKVGVFVGVEEGDYAFLAPDGELTSNHSAILASRLAYLLDFRGPAMAINTACSSALVAAHQACSSLRNSECDTALVAGVSLQLTPAGHIAMGQSGMLSQDGKCHVFDKAANGMVPGEAAVAIVLKRLSQAEADGDPIHAVIRASGLNYDGRTNGITAPSGVAQTELLKSVYENANLDPGDIEYIVTHGTGTKLGDPVEINALSHAFHGATKKRGYCALTSTKSNFGHTFAASGLLSAVSLVQAFHHKEIPASLHCKDENDYITWEDSPFYVNKCAKAWPSRSGKKRMGAVSAFGMSGTNAHMVLEEYVPSHAEELLPAPCHLLVLSAKTEDALREQIDGLSGALRQQKIQASGLTSISHTLLEGRHHFPCRMAVVVQSVEEAILSLEHAKEGGTGANFWRGRAPMEFKGQKALRKHAETLISQSQSLLAAPDAYQETLFALAELYCQGYDLSWHLLFGETQPRRVSLPTYPFARETYWMEKRDRNSTGPGHARLHPLVHVNTSNFAEQRFSSTFTGKEFFLADHRVKGGRTLPGVACLEMARAALEHAVPVDEQDGVLELSNVVWLAPLVVSSIPREVHIGLHEEGGRIGFEVSVESENEDIVTHATGKASYVEADVPVGVDLPVLRGRMMQGRLAPESCYAAFNAAGMEYGAAYQGLRDVLLGNDEVLARIALPDSVRGSAGHYILHPSLMDSAFQSTIGLELASKKDAPPRIPFALEQLMAFGSLPEEGWVWARRSPGSTAGDQVSKFDLDLLDDSGRVCVQLRGFSTRALMAPVSERKFPRIITGEEFYLVDHGALLPGVVSLEWARAAGRLALGQAVRGLKNVVWNQPLIVDRTSRELQTILTPAGDAAYAYRINDGEVLHAQGIIVGGGSSEAGGASLAIAEVLSRCELSMPESQYEALIEARLGPSMKSITAFHYQQGEALAVLELSVCVKDTVDDFILHPSLLNGALQVCNILARIEDPNGGPPTPFSLDSLHIYRAIPAEAYVHAVKQAEPFYTSSGSRLSKYDLVLTDRNGAVVVSIKGYAAISVQKPYADKGVLFAISCWSEKEASASSSREMAAPVFMLMDEPAGLRAALLRRWPDARIEAFSRADDVSESFGQVFKLVQDDLCVESKVKQPVIYLEPEQSDTGLAAACVGLFRTLHLEQARIGAKVIRYNTALLQDEVVRLLEAELGQSPGDIEIRWNEAGKRETRSIIETAPSANSKGITISDNAVIWITGGMGGVGRAFARHYAVEHKARVFLTGRSPMNAAKQNFLQELQAQGGDVHYLQCDITNRDDVDSKLKSILDVAGRVNGIIHSAGVIEDAYICDKSMDAIERVWRPKVAGAMVLDAATRDLELDFMVFFSSLTGAFGNAGQSDYAGANAFLDHFAQERNRKMVAGQRRGQTVSMAWPLWREGGMRMDEQSEILLKQHSGMTPMESAQGIVAFHQALQSGHGHILVLHGEAEKIRTKLFLTREISEPSVPQTKMNTARLSLDQIQSELRRIIAGQQKIAPEKIELDGELTQYGFDSIRLTELANRLNKAFSLELMPTLFFEHTTLRAIARYLTEKYPDVLVAPELTEAPQTGRKGSRRRRKAEAPSEPLVSQPVAIVGISGRFPGSANVNEFWRHLEANHDLIGEVPEDRWSWKEHYGDPTDQPGKTNVKSAGFMSGIDQFDPAFFGISPREAISMDPQFRLLLETVWETIEDAGYRASDFSGTKTGVFVGVSTSDYKDAWLRQVGRDMAVDGPALVSHFVVANRISYALNLNGPSEPIDTACSSSLIAIHRAIEAMRQGNCDQAIVGGVNVISAPDIFIGASRAGLLSEDGRCRTFDKAADGYGRGEGVGALLLKPLDAALRDGDHIYALVRGSAENHGGRAQSPTAPNPAAQRDLLVSAYSRANVDPRTIGYIEAHGTGTTLGDPIEVDGLKGAFEALYEKAGIPVTRKHCGLGSVKTNVGHLEAAAGIAGIMKIVMMLRHQKIPGNVHLHEPNPYLQLEGTPFYLVRETKDWESLLDECQCPVPRRAGVSSFGIGGSNAHVILEEYLPGVSPASSSDGEADVPSLIVLSARNKDRLRVSAANLLNAITVPVSGVVPNLSEIAYTLQVGRESMEERLAFTAVSMAEMTGKLRAIVEGNDSAIGVFHGRRKRNEGLDGKMEGNPDSLIKGGQLSLLLELWVQGLEVDWKLLYGQRKLRRLSLPTYPFDRKRYWFTEAGNRATAGQAPGRISLAPLGSGGCLEVSESPRPLVSLKTVEASSKISPVIEVESVQDKLIHSLAAILLVEEGELDIESPFMEMGLDSVIGVEWVHAINKQFEIKIPATRVYDHPNIPAFAKFIAAEMNRRAETSGMTPSFWTPLPSLSLDEILDRVRHKTMDITEAEQLIEKLGLQLETGELS